MTKRLDGTVALVTGASSGIGEATRARRWRRRARPWRSPPGAGTGSTGLAARVEEAGGTALVLEVDVTEEAQAREAVERTVSELGRLDTLVNNAGVMLLGPVEGAPVQEWQRMVSSTCSACSTAPTPRCRTCSRAAEDGPRQVADIVNISSVAGRVARLGQRRLQRHQVGVGAFSESLRQEVTTRHVRVSLVEPGAVATELAGHNRPEVQETMKAAVRRHAAPRGRGHRRRDHLRRHPPRHVAINEVLVRPTEQDG